MIVTRIQIYCDGEHGIPIYYPEDGAVDGAIFTPAEIRGESRKLGWRRKSDRNGFMDLCPDCARDHRSEMKRGKRPEKIGG